MGKTQVHGFVPQNFNGREFSLRVEDSQNIEDFYRREKIDTGLRYAEGFPLIAIRGELANRCKPGDRVILTLEAEYRANGKKGVRNVDLRVLSEKSETVHGTVAAGKCDHCGHHEIGIETGDGEFIALKPGDKVHLSKN